MSVFFKYLNDNFAGIVIMIAIPFALLLMLNYVCWLFKWGRHKHDLPSSNSSGGLAYILTDMVVKIITDFRHFLALILVVIFGASLAYAFSIAKDDVDKLIKALQAVVATLGGLVGSIVGYYFGESAAKKKNAKAISAGGAPVQGSEIIQPIAPVQN